MDSNGSKYGTKELDEGKLLGPSSKRTISSDGVAVEYDRKFVLITNFSARLEGDAEWMRINNAINTAMEHQAEEGKGLLENEIKELNDTLKKRTIELKDEVMLEHNHACLVSNQDTPGNNPDHQGQEEE
jgi:hypothetical protein